MDIFFVLLSELLLFIGNFVHEIVKSLSFWYIEFLVWDSCARNMVSVFQFSQIKQIECVWNFCFFENSVIIYIYRKKKCFYYLFLQVKKRAEMHGHFILMLLLKHHSLYSTNSIIWHDKWQIFNSSTCIQFRKAHISKPLWHFTLNYFLANFELLEKVSCDDCFKQYYKQCADAECFIYGYPGCQKKCNRKNNHVNSSFNIYLLFTFKIGSSTGLKTQYVKYCLLNYTYYSVVCFGLEMTFIWDLEDPLASLYLLCWV